MKMVFDTYTWIEYFLGTQKGKTVEQYLSENDIITPTIVLIELSYKAAKEGWNFKEYFEFIKSKSLTIDIKREVIMETGKVCVEMKKKQPHFSLVDVLILTIALVERAAILTGDKDFTGLEHAIFLK